MTQPHPAETPALDRALPGWAVDAITDGIPGRDARKVYGMCVRIAMSAHLRGWTEAQFVNEVAAPTARLWAQLMTRRDGRTSSMPAAMKALRKAWTTGVANAGKLEPRTRDEIAVDAVELAYAWADRLDAAEDGLSATETAVMRFVVAETERRGMLRVTCPGRVVAEAAGIPHRTAARVLGDLAERGVLVKHSAGRRGEPGKGKSAIYGLPDPWELAHSKTGSLPMCQPAEPDTTGQDTAESPHRNPAISSAPSTAEPEHVAHRDTSAETPHRDMPVQVNPWWRETFAETMRTAGHDPDALDARTMAAVERARSAGHAPELVAEALVQRQAGAA